MKKILLIFYIISQLTLAQKTLKTDTLQEVLITYQANQLTPVTFQNINEKDIRNKSFGQEPSLILQQTPSITSYSDAGHTQGYSYFRIRGIDQTRINITLDGVPLNDPVDQGVFLSNYVDILNSISKIQIQRGIGTSKNGTASYAGSIELFSPDLYKSKKYEIGFGSGSFNTMRLFGLYQSGLIEGKINGNKTNYKRALYARISKLDSDGYKQHSHNNAYSFFISGGLFFNKNYWKLNILSGKQKNGLAWMGTYENDINCDRTLNGNSEYETDDFSQTTIQLKNIFSINTYNTIETSIYHTLADGWWNFDYPNYAWQYYNDPYYDGYSSSIEDISKNSLTSNLLGFFSNYKIEKDHFKISTGFHGNTYKNDFSETNFYYEYENTKYKDEISVFNKLEYKWRKLLLFYDIQYRSTRFNYDGDVKLQEINWQFFNPKIGLSYQILPNTIIYGSVGENEREPTKYDMFEGNDVLAYIAEFDTVSSEYITPLLNTTPEKVRDYEFGIRHKSQEYIVNLNFYYLQFNNERILIGTYGPSGLPLTSEVDQSFRTGAELSLQWNINNEFILTNNSSYNYSYIEKEGQNFTPILTPPIIINQEILYQYTKNISLGVAIRYQDKSYLNFQNDEFLDEHIVVNGRINYTLDKFQLALGLNNITDNYYFKNGSIIENRNEFGNIIDKRKFYFIAAPRNYQISIKYIF